jgi:hypothetical protein
MNLAFLAFGVFGAALPAGAQDFGSSKTLLCSMSSVAECTPEGPCTPVTLESVSLPPFVKIDLAAKAVVPAREGQGDRRSEIKFVERVGGQLILQGAEGGPEEQKVGRGWTASVSEETGKMVLTVSAPDVGFVVFGACLPL